jgi:hypothetical protein
MSVIRCGTGNTTHASVRMKSGHFRANSDRSWMFIEDVWFGGRTAAGCFVPFHPPNHS